MNSKLLKIFSRERYILLLSLSAIISLSAFEFLIIPGLLYVFFGLIKKKIHFKGVLAKPILIFSSSTVISTFFFNFPFYIKSLEEGLFQLIYFFQINNQKVYWLRDSILKLFIFLGLFLYPLGLYRFFTEGKALLLWGSTFETGHFYSIFSILSLVLAIYFRKKGKVNLFYLFIGLFIAFSLMIILTFRRTAFLEFFLGILFITIILYKSRLLNRGSIFVIFTYLILFFMVGYGFLSKYDYRFKEMNKIFDKKSVNINTISSSRYVILKDAIAIIKTDIKEKNFLNILIGHGIRPGNYLPHVYDKEWKRYNRERYESFFIVSEFIERGVIGVFAILWIMISALKFFFSIPLKKLEDIKAFVFVLPLILHLIGTLFTFFWDALLPLYFLLFKVGEVYFWKK